MRPRTSFEVIIGFFLFVGAVPVCGSAEEAEGDSQDRARDLFREGVQLTDRQEWQQASERFEEALRLYDAPAIHYNLAVSYTRLERFTDAAEHLDVALAGEDLPEQTRALAQSLAEEISGRVGAIEVSWTGGDDDVAVSIDDRELTRDQIQRRVRVSPGSHVVTLARDGEVIDRQQVEVAPGAVEDVALSTITPADRDEPEEDEVATTVDRRSVARDWRLWVGVGAGLLAVVAAVVVGVAVTSEPEVEGAIPGNMQPSVLTWE
jgi:hypothetical protein